MPEEKAPDAAKGNGVISNLLGRLLCLLRGHYYGNTYYLENIGVHRPFAVTVCYRCFAVVALPF